MTATAIHPADMPTIAARHANAQDAIKTCAGLVLEHLQNDAYRAGYDRGTGDLATVAAVLAEARNWMRPAPPDVLERIDAALEAAGVEPCAVTMAA